MTPAQFRAPARPTDDFHVNELAADLVGAFSPYGPELEFPLPPSALRYRHPAREDRPNLAGGY
ncbi:MAG: hypothetical protein EPN43_00765 [Jatrophihabitans sp.]|nr:MAG: hypothetical protein EPN43_00765 [Jatrophihabitans sp.]